MVDGMVDDLELRRERLRAAAIAAKAAHDDLHAAHARLVAALDAATEALEAAWQASELIFEARNRTLDVALGAQLELEAAEEVELPA